MTGQTMLDAHVRGYAQAVRLHLADLGPDIVEDLAGGLEADLAEAVADRTPVTAADDDVVLDLAKVFGPPAQYAADLRTAAGLPAPGPVARGHRGRVRTALAVRRVRLADAWARAWQPLTSSPGWGRLRETLGELTPVWWVARGWVLGCWLATAIAGAGLSLVPTDVSQLVTALVVTVVSIQWGRGRWLPWRWMPRLVAVASAVALVVVLPIASETAYRTQRGDDNEWVRGYNAALADGGAGGYQQPVAWDSGSPSGMDGIWVDGMQVSNIFAYDADGEPLRDVQLFDDRGRPVRTVPAEQEWQPWSVPDVEGTWYFRPSLATDGRSRWNVFPLQAMPETDLTVDQETGEQKPAVGARPQQMPWPFLKAPTVIERATPSPAPSDDTGSQDTPSDEAPQEPTPTPSDQPAPSDQPSPADVADPARQPVEAPGGHAPAGVTTAAEGS